MSKDLISCPWNKQECQAFTDGRCIALKDADFGGRPCPFYKSYDQADKAWLDAIAHLVNQGKYDEAYRCAERGWLM